MKNKKLLKRIENYIKSREDMVYIYFSETINDLRYKKYRYFFKFCNTNNVAQAFKTQKEISEFLEERGF